MLKLLGMGGTFDHLHDGHKYLLDTAFSLGQEVHIGLTTEKMFSRKKLSGKNSSNQTWLYAWILDSKLFPKTSSKRSSS